MNLIACITGFTVLVATCSNVDAGVLVYPTYRAATATMWIDGDICASQGAEVSVDPGHFTPKGDAKAWTSYTIFYQGGDQHTTSDGFGINYHSSFSQDSVSANASVHLPLKYGSIPNCAIVSLGFFGSFDFRAGIHVPEGQVRYVRYEVLPAGWEWGFRMIDYAIFPDIEVHLQLGSSTGDQSGVQHSGMIRIEGATPHGSFIDIEFDERNISVAGTNSGNYNFSGSVDIKIELGACPADLSGNGAVGSADLAFLLNDWGSTDSPADLTGNGIVNAQDLAELLSRWGPCPE